MDLEKILIILQKSLNLKNDLCNGTDNLLAINNDGSTHITFKGILFIYNEINKYVINLKLSSMNVNKSFYMDTG